MWHDIWCQARYILTFGARHVIYDITNDYHSEYLTRMLRPLIYSSKAQVGEGTPLYVICQCLALLGRANVMYYVPGTF